MVSPFLRMSNIDFKNFPRWGFLTKQRSFTMTVLVIIILLIMIFIVVWVDSLG